MRSSLLAGIAVLASFARAQDIAAFDKRAATACAPLPTGAGAVPSPDTASAFLNYAPFASNASAAPIPSGYSQAFSNLQASSNAHGYLGYNVMLSYDVSTCASRCNAISGCVAINIFYERDPSVDPGPGSSGCANPPSTTIIKCVFWGGPVTSANAVNSGTWANQFQIVIAGSNGYVNNSPNNSTSSTPSSVTTPTSKPPGCSLQATTVTVTSVVSSSTTVTMTAPSTPAAPSISTQTVTQTLNFTQTLPGETFTQTFNFTQTLPAQTTTITVTASSTSVSSSSSASSSSSSMTPTTPSGTPTPTALTCAFGQGLGNFYISPIANSTSNTTTSYGYGINTMPPDNSGCYDALMSVVFNATSLADATHFSLDSNCVLTMRMDPKCDMMAYVRPHYRAYSIGGPLQFANGGYTPSQVRCTVDASSYVMSCTQNGVPGSMMFAIWRYAQWLFLEQSPANAAQDQADIIYLQAVPAQ